MAGTLIVSKLRLLCNRQISLIHLATLIAHKNDLKEDEWPNFEFYPCLQTTSLNENAMEKLSINGVIRPFRFNSSIYGILQLLYPGEEECVGTLEFIYKKKALPQLMNQKTLLKQI